MFCMSKFPTVPGLLFVSVLSSNIHIHLLTGARRLVHDIHPNDAFILVPDAPSQITATPSNPDPDFPNGGMDASEEEQCTFFATLYTFLTNYSYLTALEHHGVTCAQ
jgi:hypothetical protein